MTMPSLCFKDTGLVLVKTFILCDTTLYKNQAHYLSLIPPRVSNDCIDHLYHLVMNQLNQEHCEIRLSAFQIASELFSRSHHFRTLLVDNFQVNQQNLVVWRYLIQTLQHLTLLTGQCHYNFSAHPGPGHFVSTVILSK